MAAIKNWIPEKRKQKGNFSSVMSRLNITPLRQSKMAIGTLNSDTKINHSES